MKSWSRTREIWMNRGGGGAGAKQPPSCYQQGGPWEAERSPTEELALVCGGGETLGGPRELQRACRSPASAFSGEDPGLLGAQSHGGAAGFPGLMGASISSCWGGRALKGQLLMFFRAEAGLNGRAGWQLLGRRSSTRSSQCVASARSPSPQPFNGFRRAVLWSHLCQLLCVFNGIKVI